MTLPFFGCRSRPALCVSAVLAALALAACRPSSDPAPTTLDDPYERWAKGHPGAPEQGVWRSNPWAARPNAGAEAAPASGVVTYDHELACNGYTLVLSSHAPVADLIDMTGRSLHRWVADPDTLVWENHDEEFAFEDGGIHFDRRKYFHRAHLYPNGDLLTLIHGYGLLKLDKASNRIGWAPGPMQHDFDVAPDGAIVALSRKMGLMPEFHETEPTLDERVVLLSPDGELRREVSILQAFRESHFSPMLRMTHRYGRILNANAVRVLDGRLSDRIPAFRAGNVLVSLGKQNTICVIDLEEERVIWSMSDLWRWQHDPRVTDTGTISVFDNRGVAAYLPGSPNHLGSRIVEFDPFTQKVVWTFTGTNEVQLYSDYLGGALRLPNGNTLIAETARGRYLEITTEGRPVWEFINPNQAGSDRQYIAELHGVVRLPPDFPLNWIASPTSPAEVAASEGRRQSSGSLPGQTP
jgi:hypothetical protein